ncbi:rab guanine nucleotide exchange factor S2 [Mortierella sp. AD031]|nr:rab guanine nucleotide exchange factor S2 [Mortierella sp. AD031]
MSVTCNNCGAAVQIEPSLIAQQLVNNNATTNNNNDDPLIPYVKAQIDDLTAQNSSLVAENDSLSSKLVESTEGRMDLDQQLTITQMELQTAQKEIKSLQASQKHYEQLLAMISSGQLIEKKDVQPVIENLAYESQRRSQIESSKLKLESELEDLSKSLFEEANRMVNEERQATYMAGKKIEVLERQLDEVLDLCKSERDQLVELKVRMEKLSEEKDTVQRERDAFEFTLVQFQQQQHHQQQQHFQHAQLLTSTHHMSNSAAIRRGMSSTSTSTVGGGSGGSGGGSGGNSTPPGLNIEITAGSRKHVQQVLQYDTHQHRSSASSFKTYMESLFGTAAGTGAGGKADNSSKTLHTPSPSVASSGLSSMYSFNLMMTKTTPPAAPAANAVIPINTLLSNCKLLKKMSAEDVEATLRFEPGNLLSWTQRKRLMTAVTDNTLVVEAVPMNPNHNHHHHSAPSPVSVVASSQLLSPGVTPSTTTNNTTSGSTTAASRPNCALCGHCINTPLSYQYRLTDTANESRTICPYCRTRLTSVCTFYSVLRMISKRIISSTTTPEKLYLDFLRIRLSMFMARCGVGIVTGDEVKPKRESAVNLVGAGVNSTAANANATRNQVLMSAAAAVAAAHAHAGVNGLLPPRALESSALSSPTTPIAVQIPRVPVPVPAPAPASTITTTNIVPVQASMLQHNHNHNHSPKDQLSPSLRETDVIHEEEGDDSYLTASPVQEAVIVRP